jgi:hypothetical protein
MKINAVVYHKLVAQANEAKEQGKEQLAEGILGAVGAYPAETPEEYSYGQLQQDIYQDMWKMATRVLRYYDLKSVNAEKLDDMLVVLASDVVDAVEENLAVSGVIKSALEPKIPGEK